MPIMETNSGHHSESTLMSTSNKIQINPEIVGKTPIHPLISPKVSNSNIITPANLPSHNTSPNLSNTNPHPNSNLGHPLPNQQGINHHTNGSPNGVNGPFAFTPFIVGSNGQFAFTHYPLITTPSMFGQLSSSSFSSRGPTRQRVVNSAERRASHNAVERARRDNLNNRFQEMAEAVPTLKEIKRPSKTLIMQKTVEYVKMAQKKQETQSKEIQVVKRENEKLKEELRNLKSLIQKMSAGEMIDLNCVIVNLNSFEKENGISSESTSSNNTVNVNVDLDLDYPNRDCEKTPVIIKSEDKIETDSIDFDSYIDDVEGSIEDHLELRDGDLFGYSFDDFDYHKEKDEDFNFDVMRARVESGLVNRHDRDWLKSKGILDDTNPNFHSAQKAMEFNMKKKNLSQILATRKSKEDLVDMNIIHDYECKD